MNCEELKDLILLDALGALDAPEREILYAHLNAGCPPCEGRMAEAKALLGMMPLSLAPVQPAEYLKKRLMARIDVERDADDRATAFRIGPRRGGSIARILLGAAAGALIASAIFARFLSVQKQRVAILHNRLGAQDARMQQLEATVQQAQDAVHLVESPSVRVVSLDGTNAQPRAKARAFLDTSRGSWRLYSADLKPLASGRTYELWLISGDKKIPAATFNVDASGNGSASGAMPSNVESIAALAVTDEPAGGVPQPTGAIQLLGKL